jgi:hypothetical protein
LVLATVAGHELTQGKALLELDAVSRHGDPLRQNIAPEVRHFLSTCTQALVDREVARSWTPAL